MVKINEKYRGNDSLAITQFRGDYAIHFAEKIKESAEVLGDEFKVLQVYDGVGPAADEPLTKAVDALRSGEKVDLKKVLE